jgi:sugar lactone lactonase YvrE
LLLRDDMRAFPNGLALHPDNGHLYCAATSAARIVRVPVDGARSDGPIEQVLRMPARTLPDGLAFDALGGLLIADRARSCAGAAQHQWACSLLPARLMASSVAARALRKRLSSRWP